MDHDVLADAQAEWVILHNHVMSADLGSPSATSRHALEQRLREREYLRIVNLEDHILRRRVGRVGGPTTTREHPPSSDTGSDMVVVPGSAPYLEPSTVAASQGQDPLLAQYSIKKVSGP